MELKVRRPSFKKRCFHPFILIKPNRCAGCVLLRSKIARVLRCSTPSQPYTHILTSTSLHENIRLQGAFSSLMEVGWCPDACLACDRQTTFGIFCTLCEPPEARVSSPHSSGTSATGSLTRRPCPSRFFLPPPIDFSRERSRDSHPSQRRVQVGASQLFLRPIRREDRIVTKERAYLSEDARDLLRGYAYSFDWNRRWSNKMSIRWCNTRVH